MATYRWCTAPACASSTGATPSSPSSTPTTLCCWCRASTWVRITPRPARSPSSAWVGAGGGRREREDAAEVWVCSTGFCHSADNYTLLSRVRNKPYDVFGCWLNETHLISGNLHWIGNMTSCSVLWLNKAFQVSVLLTEHKSFQLALKKQLQFSPD